LPTLLLRNVEELKEGGVLAVAASAAADVAADASS
jgi:hypothetical protein